MQPNFNLDLSKLEEDDLDDEMDENDDQEGVIPKAIFNKIELFEQEEDEEDETESDGSILSCQICSSMFTAKKDLRLHARTKHINECLWTCNSCGAVFKDAEMFKIHLMKVHKINKECFTLDAPESNPMLKPFLTIPQDVRDCPECSSEFSNKTSLNLHRLRRHISKRLTKNVPCPVCKEETEDLTTHVRTAHDIDGVVCPHCAKILSKTCTLNRHIEQVHLNLRIHKPATCETCGKVFSKKGHLDRHVRTIHLGLKESSKPCPYCGKVFSTKSSLEPHIDMVHKGVRKACPECGKVLSDLWKHMRTVHGQYRRRVKIPKEELDLESEVLKTKDNAVDSVNVGEAESINVKSPKKLGRPKKHI